MTRNDLISKTIQECTADALYKEEVIWPELQRILPRADLQTCADFCQLEADCCSTCHSFYPHYEMTLFEHSESGYAWVCCAVYAKLHGQSGGSEAAELLAAVFSPLPEDES
jgi:hypothetical protein